LNDFRPTFVYFIREANTPFVKIGVTENLDDRLADLQVGNHGELYLEGALLFRTREEALTAERELHVRYGRYRVRGEWFRLDSAPLSGVVTVGAEPYMRHLKPVCNRKHHCTCTFCEL
jgi:T5orf172 domain